MRKIYGFNRFINESSNKYENLINDILDKINRNGIQDVTLDERKFLTQYNTNTVDNDLYDWLIDNEYTIDLNDNKLKYDEFDLDEDIFYNTKKLIRVISNATKKKPFTNNADWGGGEVWEIDHNKDSGYYIHLGDDSLIFMCRTIENTGEYHDNILRDIKTTKELYSLFSHIRTIYMSK